MLPPLLATIGKGLARKLGPAEVAHALREARDAHTFLSRTTPDEAAVERESRLRNMYDGLIARLDLDIPPGAIQPIIDHFVALTLAEWDAEFVGRSPQPPDTRSQYGSCSELPTTPVH